MARISSHKACMSHVIIITIITLSTLCLCEVRLFATKQQRLRDQREYEKNNLLAAKWEEFMGGIEPPLFHQVPRSDAQRVRYFV